MSIIAEPTPIYEALLRLADNAEKEEILNGGEREKLSARLIYGDGSDGKQKSSKAYDTMETVIERTAKSNIYVLTGIDTRAVPPTRVQVAWELLIAGHLRWRASNGIESELELDWVDGAPVRIINLHIGPRTEISSTGLTPMRPPAKLAPGERKDDTERLALMQTFLDEGMQMTPAARKAAERIPDRPSSDESVAMRLRRKYKKLLSE